MISESHGITTRSASDAGMFSLAPSPVSDVLPKKPILPPQIKFLFRGNFYAVEIISNGDTEVMSDWTPLYLSMANGTPEIGENAKDDFKKFPTYVVYDVLKIVGKPLNAIKIDPKWGFKLEENDGNILFQIETPNGPRLIPQEIVLSAFLKAMKIRAESAINTPVKEIRLLTGFELNESQKAVFEKAAAKNNLKIIFYIVNDTQ
uniref:Uncharacterized protein n=1 Tax=Panagrolaimus sp. PS1159 TaxID=55785 RepID=A0AC35GAS4_9BILA